MITYTQTKFHVFTSLLNIKMCYSSLRSTISKEYRYLIMIWSHRLEQKPNRGNASHVDSYHVIQQFCCLKYTNFNACYTTVNWWGTLQLRFSKVLSVTKMQYMSHNYQTGKELFRWVLISRRAPWQALYRVTFETKERCLSITQL